MKIKKICIIILLILILFTSSVYAAGSFSVSASSTSIYVGNTSTLTIKTSNCAGKFNVTSSNPSVATVSTSSIWVDGTSTVTITAKASGTANIVVTAADVSDIDLNDVKGSKSVGIAVKTKQAATSGSAGTSGTTSSNKKPTTSSSSKPATSKPTTTTATKKTLSSNAYLKEFRVDEPGITPDFNRNTYNYAITINESIDKLNVTAVPEDSKVTVSVSGNTNLKMGENIITVKIVAEDKKTTNTYKITVTKVEDVQKSNAYLQNIIVTNLTPAFSKEILEYDLGSVGSDVDKLEISAFAENENAKVEITGNDNLALGENIINITVTSENGKEQKIYTLKVNKQQNVADISSDKDDINKTLRKAKWANMKEALKEKSGVILLYFFVWVEFLQVVYLYEKLKKQETVNIK